ncbi:hypothetical protein BOX15_Mlig006371g1 [Macrostomum lignano]|uniref:Uncharacterized protein n=1 Tax=Macrostomum lignano TaxID=282301 RepID=A0A267FA73_9PLAT|nr:hypothetical protein BOX15_Mlig006371g3 [Macrostomum lignano]PAA70603.1 hypothetical protein BOX15_Mlig006371g2 [Macrostomum lignano]PAA72438.1 hypothetical protein BOX15_Mlig006371g1 [Macrostomum lignano]
MAFILSRRHLFLTVIALGCILAAAGDAAGAAASSTSGCTREVGATAECRSHADCCEPNLCLKKRGNTVGYCCCTWPSYGSEADGK